MVGGLPSLPPVGVPLILLAVIWITILSSPALLQPDIDVRHGGNPSADVVVLEHGPGAEPLSFHKVHAILPQRNAATGAEGLQRQAFRGSEAVVGCIYDEPEITVATRKD